MRRGALGRAALAVAAAVAIALAHAGCGSDPRELFTRPLDAGAEADVTEERAPEVDPTLGGPCTDDAQCDDHIACTFDRCDLTLARCRNVPDDAQCDDGSYCDGRERCVLRLGCAQGPVVTCQDGDPCTIDRCVEATQGCAHDARDVDGDGDPDYHCQGSRDCDDLDPNVSSLRAEVCGNFVDDNCNGVIDEVGCVQPANDVCATALSVTAPGTFLLSTVGARKDYATSCAVTTPAAAKDLVLALTVPGAPSGPPQDVELWATAQAATNEVAVALEGACGALGSELACGHVAGSPSARAIARSVAPGTTLYAIVSTQTEGAVDVRVDWHDATPKATNEDCAAPQPVALEAATTVRLIDAARDLASGCDRAKTGELTYAFTLTQPSDVRIFASTLVGDGEPVITLRDDAACTTERSCRAAASPPLFARNLPAGPHVFTVAGTRQLDASVVVRAYPPTVAPANQSCATAPMILPNTTVAVDLSAQESAIANGCLPGGLAAAYELTLTEPSDVLVIGRFPTNETGAVSLNGPACTTAALLPQGCAAGATPQRLARRNVPAGSYRVVIADERGQAVQLSVLVRPTVAPVAVGAADNCGSAFALPPTGGFFTGDTTGAVADFSAGCDAPGLPIGGAKDQLLRLDLAQPRRVVMTMAGSFFTTLLDVRAGATCSTASEVKGACYVGLGPGRSFLDLTLAGGTYWLQIDGYNGEAGPWNLDLRVLPP